MTDLPRVRFDAYVQRVLSDASWFPGRDVSAEVDRWLAAHAAELDGLTISPACRAFLNEFGGLRLVPYGEGRNRVTGFATQLFPSDDEIGTSYCLSFAEEYGYEVFPIGVYDDGDSDVVMDQTGHVFLLHWADEFDLGNSDNAIAVMAYDQSDLPLVAKRSDPPDESGGEADDHQ